MSIGQEKKNALNVRLAGYPVKYAEILKKRPDTAVVYPGERKNDLVVKLSPVCANICYNREKSRNVQNNDNIEDKNS